MGTERIDSVSSRELAGWLRRLASAKEARANEVKALSGHHDPWEELATALLEEEVDRLKRVVGLAV